MASIPYFLLRTYNSVKNIPTISAIGHMPWRMNRYRKTINHHTWKSYLKHHQLKDFSVFGEIAEIKSQFLLGTSLCLYHLNLVILANTMISLIFLQIFWEIAETSEMAVFAGHPSTSSNTCLNFSKKCDLSNFSQFLEKSQNLQKSQFLLGTLLPLLTLVLINFSKNCDFSNFSQVLLLRANLDISHCSTFFSHTCTCKLQEYSKGLDCWLGPALVFFRVWFEYLISAPSFKKWAPAQRACI